MREVVDSEESYLFRVERTKIGERERERERERKRERERERKEREKTKLRRAGVIMRRYR